MSGQFMEKIKDAGVVGAGGGGFPSWAKLKTGVDVIIVNGAECEPLLRVDQQLLFRYSEEIASALNQIMLDTGAGKGVIALKKKYKEAWGALQSACRKYPDIGLHVLEDIYPTGDEHLLAYAVTGKAIPPGQLPLSVGAIVLNVETMYNIFAALEGSPVTHKFVTVTGAVRSPRTLRVPLGMSVDEVIEIAGGATVKEYAKISGGLCMGRIMGSNEPVIKTTKGLVVLPADHQLVLMYRQDISKSLKRAMAVCSQCQQCTDLCPRYLLGNPIMPHRVMRAAAYNIADETAVKQALLCSECGVCDIYACPSGLSPRAVNKAIKKELQQKGVKINGDLTGSGVMESREWRQLPTKRLVMRLGVALYDVEAPLYLENIEAEEVRLPLKQHAGVASEPLVKKGEKVVVGQRIAVAPGGALSTNLHASINGIITAVDSGIVICGRGGGAKHA